MATPLLDFASNSSASSVTTHQLPSVAPSGDDVLLVGFVQKRPMDVIALPAGWSQRDTLNSASLGGGGKRWALLERYVATASGPYADLLSTSVACGWGTAQIALRATSGTQPTNDDNAFTFYGFSGSAEDEPSLSVTLPGAPTPDNVLLAWVTPSGGIPGTGFTPGFPEGYTIPAGWSELVRIPLSGNTSEGLIAWKLADGSETGALDFGSTRHGCSALTVFIAEYAVEGEISPDPTPGWWIDWDRDGFGDSTTGESEGLLARMLPEGVSAAAAFDNITADVKSSTLHKPGSNDHYGRVAPGSMTIIVKNHDGKYNPDNAASPLFGKLKPGLAVWFGTNVDGTVSGTGQVVKGRFAGYVREIVPTPVAGSSYEAQIICDDPLARYEKARPRVEFSADRSAGEYRTAILEAIGETRYSLCAEADTLAFSGTTGTRNRGVTTGSDFSPADALALARILDKQRTPAANALALLEELNSLSGVRHFVQAADTKEDWYAYTTVPRTWKMDAAEDADFNGDDITNTSGYRVTADAIVNLQEVDVRPTRTASGPGTVWRSSDVPIMLDGSTPYTVTVDFGDYVFDAELHVANTGSVADSFTSYGTGAVIRLDGTGTVSSLTVAGRPVISEPSLTVESRVSGSVTAYGESRGPTISSELMQSRGLAQGIANFTTFKFAQPLKRQKVTIPNTLDTTLARRLYDVVTQTLDRLSIAGRRFEITGITERWSMAASADLIYVEFDFDLQETPNQTALSFFRIGISELGGTDGLAP